jgi:hypothetical protein
MQKGSGLRKLSCSADNLPNPFYFGYIDSNNLLEVPMRKSPITIALSLTLLGFQAFAVDTFDSQLAQKGDEVVQANPSYNPEEPSSQDKAITQARKTALTGAVYDDNQLKELRQMLSNSEIERRTKMETKLKLPLEPDEVKDLRKKLTAIEKAQNEPLSGIEFRIRNVTYNPDSNQPIVIQVADGFSAQVEFYDASGQPWSIRKDGVVGDSESFSRKIMGEDRHISSFSLSSRYKQSNAAVVLEGLSNSIPVLLMGSDKAVDGRVSVTIPRMGPNAEIQPIMNNELNNVSPELVKLQGGDAPVGSKPLRVAGIENSEAWFDGEFLYLSLPGRLLLPPSINSSVSPSGRFLYKTAPATYISVSLNGDRRNGTIEGLYQTEIRRAKTIFEQGVK